MNNDRNWKMSFPHEVSGIFRFITFASLTWELCYLVTGMGRLNDSPYLILIKILVCFTAFISFLNDKQRELVVSKKGFLFEELKEGIPVTRNMFSFVYMLMLIGYNPVVPLIEENFVWIFIHILTLSYIVFRIWLSKVKPS